MHAVPPVANCPAVSRYGLIALSGQSDTTANGGVVHPNDLSAQVTGTMGRIESVLQEMDAELRDLVKLVVFYPQARVDDAQLLQRLGRMLGGERDVVVTLVPLRELGHRHALVEIDAYAMPGAQRSPVLLPELADPGPGFCHGLRCGEFVFVGGQSAANNREAVLYAGDLVSQNRQVIHNLESVLQALGSDNRSIVKANSWRAAPTTHSAYVTAAKDRFAFFAASRPAVTGITVPGLERLGHLVRLDLWAMERSLPRAPVQPRDHWQWKLETPYSHGLQCGDWLFIGGQAALDAQCNVLHPDDTAAQSAVTMAFVHDILDAANGRFEDVIKLNTYSCGSGSNGEIAPSVHAYSGLLTPSGPASSSVPVDNLAYPGQAVEIEAIAVSSKAVRT